MRYNAHTLDIAHSDSNDPSNGLAGNGVATNGKESSSSSLALVQPAWSTLYEDSAHDREQVVRTILQALRDVGYTEAATTLEHESGYRLESDDVAQLRHSITAGLWDQAPAFLRRLGVAGDNERTARFLISQQKYLEQLEALQPTAALQTLRGELVVYCTEPERLHYLSRQIFLKLTTPESSLIMCSSGADVMERAHWDGAMGSSRAKLLAELQRLISPSIMLPPRRLDTLLSHARTYQRSSCTHHAGSQADKAFSLYVNHSCSRTQFPTLTTHILAEHLDEVWRLEWSHDGQFLASASQDKTAIIWKIADLPPDADPTTRQCVAERVLSGHEYAVNALAWSPDDKILLTSAEHIIKMWDVSTGASLRDLQNDSHSDMITCLVWLPDGTGFVSGSMDCHIVVWMYELGAIDEKPLPIRVTDLTITPDGSRLVAVGTIVQPPTTNNFDPSRQTRSMKVFSLSSRNELFSVGLSNEVTSVKATADSRYVLISHAPDEVQLWDLDAQRMCQKYTGHYQGKHVIRSCLGGPDEGFVLSGSEDQTLYVWKRETGVLIEVLSGHGSGCVNDVAWNPRDSGLFASCSDDHTIRLWCPPPSGLVSSDLQDRHNLASH
ncbi:WD40-repeat-containing domain protein [Rhizoctonia solani]|nr:WD40-repeat-containing domain protein [Rhizoctonia solani]